MANELKFLKGLYANWTGLTKNADSFYIVEHRNESNEFVKYDLYLGDKFLCDGVSKADLTTAITNLVNGAGENYNTLGKLATKVQALETAVGEGGSVAAQITAAIEALDANFSVTSEDGFVTVQVTETDGKLTAVSVTTNDIAKSSELTALKNAVGDGFTATDTVAKAIDANKTAINTLNAGSGTTGSVAKAVADAKTELLGNVSADYNTLGKLEKKVNDVAAAKTYRIVKVVGDELTSLGANVNEAYKLVENGNAKAGEYIKVYKDSALQSVALVGQELQFKYLLASGQTSTVSVDVSNFLAESEFKDGLQVVDHVVSVKRDGKSENFLTVSADGVKLSGVQDAINSAKKVATDRLDVIEGTDQTVGSIAKALKDAKDYTDAEIVALNATAGTQNVSEGKHVAVEVVETAGKLTSLVVTEDDIASASALTAEIGRATSAETALDGRLAVIEGEGVGSINKAVADAKSDLIGDAAPDYNTLAKLEGKIKYAEAAAKAAATKLNKASDASHLTLNSVTGASGEITYTIGESDIASANALTAETQARTDADDAIKGRLNVLEGVTVTGENAIVVDESDAKKSKKVSLKLGTQPAEGVASVVLSQDANGLVAKLQWGTF